MPSLFFFLQNCGEKLLSHTSGMLIKEPSHGSVWLFGCLSHDARTYILFPYWTNVVPLQLSHPPITHRCLHTILKAYTEVYATLAYSSVVEQQIVNLWVVGSIPTMPVMSTLVQKPMSAMEEQKLAVDIINLLSTNVIRDGSRTV
jgi:hypothetical protein